MNIYQGVVRGGSHVVHCDRLDEFFKEFIEYRKWKATTNNFDKNTFPFKEWKKATNHHPYNPEKDWYWAIFYLNLDNDKTKDPIVYWERPLGWETSFDYSTGWDLGINVKKAFKIKKNTPLESSEWKQWNQQKEKIEKVLKDIWVYGEIKDTYGLDMNWPQTKESNYSKAKETNEENSQIQQSNQGNSKIYWIFRGLALVGLVGLIAWFVFKKKSK